MSEPSVHLDPPAATSPMPPGSAAADASRAAGSLAGLVAAMAALATGELAAAMTGGAPSPVIAVGAAVIDLAPPGSKELVVELFGTNDKLALTLLVALSVLAAGALIGLVARRSRRAAQLLITGLVAVGGLAAMRDPTASAGPILVSSVGQVVVGVAVLEALLRAAVPTGVASGVVSGVANRPPDAMRRRFLVRTGGLGLLSLAGYGIGRSLLDARAARTAGAAGGGAVASPLPQTVDPALAVAPENALDVPGITPLVTPNEDFYRIDTALITPAVDIDTWRLRVHGRVDRELELTFDELLELPVVERYVTIACVSNRIGGQLIGNAKWTGVRLTDVLDLAGLQPGAAQVVPISIDGWAAGFPTEWVTSPDRPRDALIAVRMNDEPLPVEHGYPARLIVPGLYGYVSATKWLTEIKLTSWEAFDSYWVPRGWAKEGPVLTQCRIDVPKPSALVQPGDQVAVAGVAWAMDRGISKVEVQVDDGEWNEAQLADPIGPQTWVQWKWGWTATPGRHTFTARATDGTGEVQESRVTPPNPDGSRGYPMRAVQVG